MQSDSQDRAAGALIGLAAGDKNHGPSEMAWRLASSLAELERFDPEDVFARYLEWHRKGSYDTGAVARIVFDQAVAGVERKEAVARAHEKLDGMTAGVNPAHRVAPLAMAAFISDDNLEAAARSEAALTHAHPLAGDTAAAVAILCRKLIRGLSWEEAIAAAARFGPQEVAVALQPDDIERTSLSDGGFAPETLRAAVWHLHHARTLDEALSDSLEFSGPDNYCPVIVGAIGGARWSAGSVPQTELEDHPLARDMRDVAGKLASLW
jgi:ADP-ribosyl-[dinitrogen reductase] hydrolase